MSPARPKPVVLCILDGWGHREDTSHNAIAAAKTPVWDGLLRDYPHGPINASELHVGLPEGQMGNSEVGHMNIGSGRVVMQDLPRIDAAIADGSLAKNPELLAFIDSMKKSGKVCHLMGLLSPGGVHSHQSHIAALANILMSAGIKTYIHAFLDGRDTPPKSALEYLSVFTKACPKAVIATVSGRYYAMDRDNRWERVEKAYRALVAAEGEKAASAEAAVQQSYAADKTDEFVLPTVIGSYIGMQPGDGILMANFRADRAREILQTLLDPAFDKFPRAGNHAGTPALGMVEYSTTHNRWMKTMFAPESLNRILGEIVADAKLKQLRIAETEKYAHVTFFFNGGREQEFPGESRILIPSPKVATYDMKPEMSAYEVTDKLVDAIRSDQFDLIVVNYANTDMVGHTGDISAASKAVEAVDACLGRVIAEVESKGGAMIITADHGNAECMHDEETKQPHTAHTLELVPFIVIGSAFRGQKLSIPEGRLADVAPSILSLMNLPQPKEMTGRSLIPTHATRSVA